MEFNRGIKQIGIDRRVNKTENKYFIGQVARNL